MVYSTREYVQGTEGTFTSPAPLHSLLPEAERQICTRFKYTRLTLPHDGAFIGQILERWHGIGVEI